MSNFNKIVLHTLRKCILTILLFLPHFLYAQARPEMADTLRSNGKIYVVVLVICTIFAGIIFFLTFLERRIKKMEQNQQQNP